MKYLNLIIYDFFILYFLLIINQINSASYADSLEIVAQFNIIEFKISPNEIKNCTTCMLAGVKLSKNGTIFCSFPRWFDNVTAKQPLPNIIQKKIIRALAFFRRKSALFNRFIIRRD
jgi:hypothetical protein